MPLRLLHGGGQGEVTSKRCWWRGRRRYDGQCTMINVQVNNNKTFFIEAL